MNYHYCLKNFECGMDENGCRYMMLALYKAGARLSIERVYQEEPDGPFEFCQDIREGQYCAFDVLADHMGEDAAAYRIDEYCFEPCWEHPGKLHIIDGESFDDSSALHAQLNTMQGDVCPNHMSLELPVIPECFLWDEEGFRRFAKCFAPGV